MKKREFGSLLILLVFLHCLTIIGCDEKEGQKTTESKGTTSQLARSRYSDLNGYFKIVPPSEWRIQKYPQDPRGKVAFHGPDGAQLRVLVKGLDYNSFEEMLEEIRGIEKQIGTNTNVEEIIFSDKPAVKRTFVLRGTKILFIDFMIGNTTHNLMYSASPTKFDKYHALAWKSISTYESTLQGVSAEDVKKHTIARSLRLSTIFFDEGNYELSMESITEGLEVDPNNAELQELKEKITKETGVGSGSPHRPDVGTGKTEDSGSSG